MSDIDVIEPVRVLPNHLRMAINFKEGIAHTDCRRTPGKFEISFNTRTNIEMIESMVVVKLNEMLVTKPGFKWDNLIYIKPTKNSKQVDYQVLTKGPTTNFPMAIEIIYERAAKAVGFVPGDYIFDIFCYLTKDVVQGVQRATAARIDQQLEVLRSFVEANPTHGFSFA